MKENYVAFCGLTLLECGVPATDPAIIKAADYAREAMPRINRTYPAALFLLFFDRLNDPQDKGHIQELAMRLIAGQSPNGGWSYRVPLLSAKDATAIGQALRQLGQEPIDSARRNRPELFRNMPRSVSELGLFKMEDNAGADYFRVGGDNSNTQFALLALWAAQARFTGGSTPGTGCAPLSQRSGRRWQVLL